MAKKKSKKQSRMDQLIGAAEELNELMGLKPPIPTEDVEEVELEELLLEARGMLKPGEDDDLSKKTVKVLDSIEIPEEEEEDEPEEEEEPEEEAGEEEELEELSIDDLLEEVKATKKRKELVEIIEDEEAFEGMGSISKLRSGKALQGAMIKHLESLGDEPGEEEEVEEPEEAEEAAEEPAEEEKPKKAKSKKSSKKGGKKAAKKTGKKSTKKSTKKSSTKKDKKDKPGKTDFGHSATSQAGKIDNYLMENEGKEVSINDVAEAAGAREARVKSHLRHLAKNKGLDIEYTEEDDETFVTYTA